SLTENSPGDGFDRFLVWLGLFGVTLLAVYNLLAVAYWLGGSSIKNSGLVGFGTVVGLLASWLYVQRARRTLGPKQLLASAHSQPSVTYPGPAADDWALLGIGLGFVAAGLFLLPKQPKGGLVTVIFFGACAYAG